jgi:hypothetical protein
MGRQHIENGCIAKEACWLLSRSAAGSRRFSEFSILCRRRRPGTYGCGLNRLVARVLKVANRSPERVVGVPREATRPAGAVAGLVTDLVRPRRALLAENVLLRQ